MLHMHLCGFQLFLRGCKFWGFQIHVSMHQVNQKLSGDMGRGNPSPESSPVGPETCDASSQSVNAIGDQLTLSPLLLWFE